MYICIHFTTILFNYVDFDQNFRKILLMMDFANSESSNKEINKMFSLTIALLFLIKMRFHNKSITQVILNRYGSTTLTSFRKYEKYDLRYQKNNCDIEFLEKCLINNLKPNFLNFKMSIPNFRSDDDYKSFQCKILRKELNSKRLLAGTLAEERKNNHQKLKLTLSYLDFNHIICYIAKLNTKKIEKVKDIQRKKLFKLGLRSQYDKIPYEKIIFNYSSITLSDLQKEALSYGLKFAFSPLKLNYVKHFSSFETFFKNLSLEPVLNIMPDTLNYIKMRIQNIAYRSFYSFRPYESLRHKKFRSSLKELSKIQDLLIMKPDKSNGIVLLNKQDYKDKMLNIIQDSSKFVEIHDDSYKTLLKYEEKANRFIDKLYNNKIITEDLKGNLKSTGSRLGIMYGLPKVHKENVPLRPILSATNSFNYQLSKTLVKMLSPLITKKYSLKDSFEFAKIISQQENQNYIMTSFDITSLFTNIPVKETCEIILNQLFPTPTSSYCNFEKKNFKEMLEICTKDNLFIFDKILYKQIEGAPMGAPVSATIAEIFLQYHEEKWLQSCPAAFKPVLYKRYVDDIFILFRHEDHIKLFHDYLNSQHNCLSFSFEKENNKILPFLDIKIKNCGQKFSTGVYHKPTSSGVCLKYNSNVENKFKFNLIKCLVDRAFKICSSYSNFMFETDHLKK